MEWTDNREYRCFGYAQGVMGGLLTVQQFLDRFPQVDIVNNNSFQNAWVAGMSKDNWRWVKKEAC
jgi:hypothetical protein